MSFDHWKAPQKEVIVKTREKISSPSEPIRPLLIDLIRACPHISDRDKITALRAMETIPDIMDRIHTYRKPLSSAFIWQDTPQGREFWRNMDTTLIDWENE